MSGSTRAVATILLALLALPAPANDLVPGKPSRVPILLQGGDLYTVSGGVVPSGDLLIEDGMIRAIGVDLEVPGGAEIVSVRGKRVYPGLIAPQSTLGLIEVGAVRATSDRAEVGSITPEVATHIAYNPDSELIPTVRAHGITTAQIVPLGALVRGRSSIMHLDGWTKEDAGVRLIDGLQITWPSVALRVGWWVESGPEKQKEKIDAERRKLRTAFGKARAYHLARQADPEMKVDLRLEAMRPVLDRDLPVYIAADDYRQIVEAVDFADAFGLRMVLVGGKESYRLTDLLIEREIPVILGTTTSLPMRPDDDYDLPYKLPAMLHEAGVEFCLAHVTWGAWDVRNLAFQAGQAVAYGLPDEVALRAITLSTAEILGIDDRQGSLEVGKDATLFVSEGDVMDTLGQRVVRMYIAGRPVDLDNRHKALERKYREKRYPVE